MKLITYSKDDSISCGLLTADFIIDIPSAWPAPSPPRSVKEILEMHSMPYGKGRPCLQKRAGKLVLAKRQAVARKDARKGLRPAVNSELEISRIIEKW